MVSVVTPPMFGLDTHIRFVIVLASLTRGERVLWEACYANHRDFESVRAELITNKESTGDQLPTEEACIALVEQIDLRMRRLDVTNASYPNCVMRRSSVRLKSIDVNLRYQVVYASLTDDERRLLGWLAFDRLDSRGIINRLNGNEDSADELLVVLRRCDELQRRFVQVHVPNAEQLLRNSKRRKKKAAAE